MRARGVGSGSRLILLQRCTVPHGEAMANAEPRIGGPAVDERGSQAEEGVRQDSPATPITAQAPRRRLGPTGRCISRPNPPN